MAKNTKNNKGGKSTKTPKAEREHRTLTVRDLQRDLASGKMSEKVFENTLTKHFRKKGWEPERIEKRIRRAKYAAARVANGGSTKSAKKSKKASRKNKKPTGVKGNR